MFAAISVNWSAIAGVALIGSGVLGSVGYAIYWYLTRQKPLKPVVPSPEKSVVTVTATDVVKAETKPGKRGADDPPPVGAVAWVEDIVDAMSAAEPKSKLEALLAGASRNMAQDKRIKEVEAADTKESGEA